MDLLEYFMAICKEEVNGYKTFPLYFINNSRNPIDVMIVIRPDGKDQIPANAKLADISDDMIKKGGIEKYQNIPPVSYIEVAKFQDWDFDFANERDILIRASGKEKHLNFFIDKYLWSLEKVHDVPVLHKSGWICL